MDALHVPYGVSYLWSKVFVTPWADWELFSALYGQLGGLKLQIGLLEVKLILLKEWVPLYYASLDFDRR